MALAAVDVEALLAGAAAARLTPRGLVASGATADQLKAALAARGLKVGGSAEERAERLLSVAGTRRADEVPKRLRAANFDEAGWFAQA